MLKKIQHDEIRSMVNEQNIQEVSMRLKHGGPVQTTPEGELIASTHQQTLTTNGEVVTQTTGLRTPITWPQSGEKLMPGEPDPLEERAQRFEKLR